jgi:hypothetical protein
MPTAISPTGLENIEGVLLVVLVISLALWLLIAKLRSTRPGLRIAAPIAVGFGLRLAAIAAIGATGSLSAVLRGGDETTYLDLARVLASQPLGHGDLPSGAFQLQTVLFGLQLRTGFLGVSALRITQVGLALGGIVLICAAVHDLADARAARLAAWLLAFEPTGVFFDSGILKDPLMELAAGLVVFGGTMIWLRLDVRGILICALGGLIAVETRSYAGWFLVAAGVLLLLHAALRSMDRPLRAMPAIVSVAVVAVLATPALLQASSKQSLQRLQQSQNANASGAGQGTGGANSSNLALEQVNFSTRGEILRNLPKRIRDVILRPYPWQLGDTSQRIGAIGTLVAYAVLLLLIRYAWLSRGQIMARAAPLIYPLLFLLVAYSLSAGNAGTSFRYRSHLVTLAIGVLVILRGHVLLARGPLAAPDGSPARFLGRPGPLTARERAGLAMTARSGRI